MIETENIAGSGGTGTPDPTGLSVPAPHAPPSAPAVTESAAPQNIREDALYDIFPFLGKRYSFRLRYEFGKRDLADGFIESSAFNIFRLIQETLRARGEAGAWSFSHHAHHGDFLRLFESILNDVSFLSREQWPDGWNRLERIRSELSAASAAQDWPAVLKLNDQIFDFARSLQCDLVWEMRESIGYCLRSAAKTFVKDKNGSVQIWASALDWFQQEWGRDTFISLPGLLLATKRFEDAKKLLRGFSRFERKGLVPNRIWDAAKPDTIEYNTADGSLWFIHAIHQFAEYTGDWSFVSEMWPTVQKILLNYSKGTGYKRLGNAYGIKMDEDGLIVSPEQSTWMDADPNAQGKPVTPRNGKAVEINALWYGALLFAAEVAQRRNEPEKAGEYLAIAARAKESFNEKFWNEEAKALLDVIEGDPKSLAIRPNMIIAVSHGGDLLSPERQEAVFQAATRELVTLFGLRTLSAQDPDFQPRYDTNLPVSAKDLAYHQGTVWPWLWGSYIDALVRVRKYQGRSRDEIKAEIKILLTPTAEFLLANEHHTLPEVFDGAAPYRPGGTRSQAWSVAEVLRIVTEYID